jgi:O-antigen ligase
MDFIFFQIVQLILFLRPGDINPEWERIPLYEIFILGTLLFAGFGVFRQFLPPFIYQRPIPLLLGGLMIAAAISGTMMNDIYTGRTAAFEIAKISLYFVLVLAVINTPGRLKWFLILMIVNIVLLTVFAVLVYHEVLYIPALARFDQGEWDPASNSYVKTPRLRSAGIYNDPNDLSLIISVGILLSMWAWENKRAGSLRHLWVLVLAFLTYGLYLTKSRGGVFAFGAGMIICLYVRYGLKNALRVGLALFIPVAVMIFASRTQAVDLTNREDSAQSRILLWSEGMKMFTGSPLWGNGFRTYVDEAGQVAHNSFLHLFAELGWLGGYCLVGIYFAAILGMWRLRVRPELHTAIGPHAKAKKKSRPPPRWPQGLVPSRSEVQPSLPPVAALGAPAPAVSPELIRVYPYLLGLLIAYAIGMMSLSRGYVPTTYIFPGLATAFMIMLPGRELQALIPRMRVRLLVDIAVLSVVFLVGMKIFVQVFANYGGSYHE